MNKIRIIPLVLVLLLSLATLSFATGSEQIVSRFTPDPSSNTMSIFVWLNQTGCTSCFHTGGAVNISTENQNGSSAWFYLSGITTSYCYGGPDARDYCTANIVLSGGPTGWYSCNEPQMRVFFDNDTADIAHTAPNCTTEFGSDWWPVWDEGGGQGGYITNASPTVGPPGGHGPMTRHFAGGPKPERSMCMYRPVSDASYYYFNRELCKECAPEGVYSCNATNHDKLVCSSGHYQVYETCANGAWSYCNLTSSSQCSVETWQSCNATVSCPTGQVCSCGVGGSPFNYTACTGSAQGICYLNSGQMCTDDLQCLYGLCYGRDSGEGICATPCSTNDTCPSAYSSCVDIYATFSSSSSFSNYRYWCGPGVNDYCVRGYIYLTNYCMQQVSAFCSGNDECYSQNCKPDCATGTVSRCMVPTYSCYCQSNADCGSGQSCVQVSYSGPVSSSNGIVGQKVCVQGRSNGQTCSSNSECSSGNCQNGYCCSLGKVCCSSDSQCPSTQACYTNSGWASTILYYSCNDKKPYAFYCREDKECVTPPCVDYQCSGTPIPTYINYTTTLPTNRTISIDDVFNITASYLISSNNSAPPSSGCIIYVDDILQSYSLCGTISIQITSVGVHNVRISGQALGYETASTPDIQVIVINPVGVNYSIGSRCDMDSNCVSGRCEFVQEQYYRRCRTNSDCLQGGTCSGADSFLNLQGWCSNLVSYGICCANDTMQCCDPLGWARCDNAYSGFQCSAATYTCSQVTKSAGTQCNSQLDCNPGLLCLPNTGTYKYCCAATSTLDMCCNIDSECPSGYVCDSAYGGTYVCTKPSGGPGLEEPCSSTHQCIGEEGAALTCKNGICQPFECKRGVPCVICLNSTGQRVYMTAIECGISNNTRSVYCAVSMAQCNNDGGQQTSVGGVVSGTTIEDLFNQLLVLLFWVMIAVIFFFIIAMFISGLHLAYGLVKK